MADAVDHEEDPFLRLYFTPSAIRAHFECDDNDATEGLSDDTLAKVGAFALQDDALYSAFHRALVHALEEVAREEAKN